MHTYNIVQQLREAKTALNQRELLALLETSPRSEQGETDTGALVTCNERITAIRMRNKRKRRMG